MLMMLLLQQVVPSGLSAASYQQHIAETGERFVDVLKPPSGQQRGAVLDVLAAVLQGCTGLRSLALHSITACAALEQLQGKLGNCLVTAVEGDDRNGQIVAALQVPE
jgi:hypothetical protein